MRASLAVAALLLSACGGPDIKPDFVSTRGVENYLNGEKTDMSLKLADEQEGYLLGALIPYGFENVSIKGVDVRWRPHAWIYEDGKTSVVGEESLGHISVSAGSGCSWNGAYTHEMLHAIQEKVGIIDYNHARPEWKVINDRPIHCDDIEQGAVP